ncbi:acyl-CoA N-acyltransferase [Pholiota conissans]|uniref:Acyl-CoA N-acyltransferase n=1 Tax=Pholiota conissans TaxID=109636 RepID=A0A9P5Z8R2_9AGAR|nr:acyl-CoA N-acyltransferase [Pholiota conissans]
MPSTIPYTIRDAEERDLPGILEIMNEQIRTSTAVFIDDPIDLADREAWFKSMKASSNPIFVAVPIENENDPVVTSAAASTSPSSLAPPPSVLGYTYYSSFLPPSRAGYRYTFENTLYVHGSLRGSGIGSALMAKLIQHARGRVRTLVARTSGDNEGSIAFHEKHGFVRCGLIREAGLKFGEWQDTAFLQLMFEEDPRTFGDGKAAKG